MIIDTVHITLIAPHCRLYFHTAYQGLAKVICLCAVTLCDVTLSVM